MQNKELALNLPEHLMEMTFIEVFFPQNDDIGVLVLGENMTTDSIDPVVRVYLLSKEASEFEVISELEAFAFNDYSSAMSFSKKLGIMSGLEMLIMLREHVDITDEVDSHYIQ